MSPAPSPNHRWKFFSAGGVNQVAFRSGADLANLAELDLKLWVALAVLELRAAAGRTLATGRRDPTLAEV